MLNEDGQFFFYGMLASGMCHEIILFYVTERQTGRRRVSSIAMIYEDVFTVLASAEYSRNMAET